MVPSLTRQQIIAWSAVGLAILLIGAYFLRGEISRSAVDPPRPITMGMKEKDAGKPSTIKVHVAGAVAAPGLYEFSAGDRIADALQKAGGTTPAADVSSINLAAKLADGQQVFVPEPAAPAAPQQITGGSAQPGGTGHMSGSPATGPINLNTATAAQLEELDGIGPKTAQKIIEFRDTNGGFQSVEDLLQVPGIGPSKFDQLKDQVSV